MKKQLDTTAMENELKSGSLFFQKPAQFLSDSKKKSSSPPLLSPKPSKDKGQPAKSPRKASQSTKAVDSISQPNLSTELADSLSLPKQSTISVDYSGQLNQSTKSVDSSSQLLGAIVKRPLAFYIPESINQKIEEAVRYYQEKHHKKIDRSTLVSALLGDPAIWEKPALDTLADKVMIQLKNRLTARLTDRLS